MSQRDGYESEVSHGIDPDAAEILIEEWRMAAKDERGQRKARIAYEECAAELEHVLNRLKDGETDE